VNCSGIFAAFIRLCALALVDAVGFTNRAAQFFHHAAWRLRSKAPFLANRAAVLGCLTLTCMNADACSRFAAEFGVSTGVGVGAEF